MRHHHYTPPSVSTVPDLFDPPAVNVDTSWEAAGRIQPQTHRLREAVYAYIKARGEFGATGAEIGHGITMEGSTYRPRLRELEGDAPWAKGKLPARIRKSDRKRNGMRVYVAIR